MVPVFWWTFGSQKAVFCISVHGFASVTINNNFPIVVRNVVLQWLTYLVLKYGMTARGPQDLALGLGSVSIDEAAVTLP